MQTLATNAASLYAQHYSTGSSGYRINLEADDTAGQAVADNAPLVTVNSESFAAGVEELVKSVPEAQSWVGTGANAPIPKDTLLQIVDESALNSFATARGLDKEEAARALANELPQFIDAVSPNGTVEVKLVHQLMAQAMTDEGSGTAE